MVKAVPEYFVIAFPLVVSVIHSLWSWVCNQSSQFCFINKSQESPFQVSANFISSYLTEYFTMLKGLALCLCRASCSFYIWTLSGNFYFFSYLNRIRSDRSSPVLPFEEWPTMQSLARYSLGSDDNAVSLPIALQLKWLIMGDMSRIIPFMSIAGHTSHTVWRCFGGHFGLTCLLRHYCVSFGTVVSWGAPFPLFKAPTVDTDAVGAIGHCVRNRI